MKPQCYSNNSKSTQSVMRCVLTHPEWHNPITHPACDKGNVHSIRADTRETISAQPPVSGCSTRFTATHSSVEKGNQMPVGKEEWGGVIGLRAHFMCVAFSPYRTLPIAEIDWFQGRKHLQEHSTRIIPLIKKKIRNTMCVNSMRAAPRGN